MSQILIVQDQGVAGPAGPQGIQGPPGAGGASYAHVQGAPLATWTIVHNLGFFPSVTVVDSGGTTVEGDMRYIDVNTVELSFSAAFGGSAYLS